MHTRTLKRVSLPGWLHSLVTVYSPTLISTPAVIDNRWYRTFPDAIWLAVPNDGLRILPRPYTWPGSEENWQWEASSCSSNRSSSSVAKASGGNSTSLPTWCESGSESKLTSRVPSTWLFSVADFRGMLISMLAVAKPFLSPSVASVAWSTCSSPSIAITGRIRSHVCFCPASNWDDVRIRNRTLYNVRVGWGHVRSLPVYASRRVIGLGTTGGSENS